MRIIPLLLIFFCATTLLLSQLVHSQMQEFDSMWGQWITVTPSLNVTHRYRFTFSSSEYFMFDVISPHPQPFQIRLNNGRTQLQTFLQTSCCSSRNITSTGIRQLILFEKQENVAFGGMLLYQNTALTTSKLNQLRLLNWVSNNSTSCCFASIQNFPENIDASNFIVSQGVDQSEIRELPSVNRIAIYDASLVQIPISGQTSQQIPIPKQSTPIIVQNNSSLLQAPLLLLLLVMLICSIVF